MRISRAASRSARRGRREREPPRRRPASRDCRSKTRPETRANRCSSSQLAVERDPRRPAGNRRERHGHPPHRRAPRDSSPGVPISPRRSVGSRPMRRPAPTVSTRPACAIPDGIGAIVSAIAPRPVNVLASPATSPGAASWQRPASGASASAAGSRAWPGPPAWRPRTRWRATARSAPSAPPAPSPTSTACSAQSDGLRGILDTSRLPSIAG